MYSLGVIAHYPCFFVPDYIVPHFPLSRSGDLQPLHQDELITIQKIIENTTWGSGECAKNIAVLLGMLPDPIATKLKVVLSTHELKPFRYYDTDYKFHVFLLGNTEYGLRIFDIASTYDVNDNAKDWLQRALSKESLKYCLINDFLLRRFPQFRFIEGEAYRLFYTETIQPDSCLLTPNLMIKYQDRRCFNYRLWNDSFFLNMYETWKLFSGQKTYGESVALHVDGLVSPQGRLSDNCIRELRDALQLY